MAGTIEINLDTSTFSFDSTSVDFEQPTSGTVNNATGDFAPYIGAEVTYKDFDYTAVPAGGIEELWSIASAGISFNLVELLYSSYTSIGNIAFVNLAGKGWLDVGGESIAAWWSFSADSNRGVFNYSSTTTTSVPDNGASVALLGLGLLALGTAQRLRRRELAA